jgi:hypothetical protein
MADGWIRLNNNTKQIKVDHWEIDITSENLDTEEQASDKRYTFYLGEIGRKIKCYNAYFDDHNNAEEFIANMKTWNKAGPWPIEIIINTSSHKFKIDGTNTYVNVINKVQRAISKIGRGDEDFYVIRYLEFWQADAK